MSKARSKPLSFNTTMRNPDRLEKFLEILSKYEGKILSELPQHDGEKIIYGSACRIDENFLEENKIIFRQIPKELKL